MSNITINNYGTLNLHIADKVTNAKDMLLTRLYYARNSEHIIGGRDGWYTLLDLYYMGNYEGMRDFIQNCKGRCGTRRKEMLQCLDIIIKGESL